jgi:hypothetical protein
MSKKYHKLKEVVCTFNFSNLDLGQTSNVIQVVRSTTLDLYREISVSNVLMDVGDSLYMADGDGIL